MREELVTAVAVQLALPHHEIHDALAGLRSARMLDGDQFVHAVVQNTAYVRTTRARRRTLHLAAADACHHLVPDEERSGFLARHLYLAGAGPRAIDALESAAEDALKFGRHEEAVLHLRRQVELLAGTEASEQQRAERPSRLLALGELCLLLGRYLEAEVVLRDAVAAGVQTRGELALMRTLRRLGRHPEVELLAHEALARGGLSRADRALLSEERARSMANQGRLDDALAELVDVDDPLIRARNDLLRGYIWGEQDREIAALAVLEEAVATFIDRGDDESAAHGLRLQGEILGSKDGLEAADRVLRRALELARAAGAAAEVMLCLNYLTAVADRLGSPAEAVAFSREAVVQSDRLRHANGRASSRNNLAFALLSSNDPVGAETWATAAIELSERAGLTQLAGSAFHTRGVARLTLGDRSGARADAEAALRSSIGADSLAEARELLARVLEDDPEDAPMVGDS